MTDNIQSIRDDLAYLRALAEEGRRGGDRGGVIALAAGLIFATCSVVQWAALERLVGGVVSNGTWLVGTLAFFAILFRFKRRAGSGSGRARLASVAWMGVGWAIFTLFAALTVATWRTQNALLIYFAPSIIFALYGAAWTVAAAVSGKAWVRLTAMGSFAGSIVCAWFISDPVQYLVYAAGLLLLAALPGFIMMRQEARAEA